MTRSRKVLIGVGAFVALIVAVKLVRTPRSDRNWVPDQARMVTVTFDGDSVHLKDMRDADPHTRAPAWIDRSYDLAALDSAWLIVAPFTEKWRGPAHTFVTFGFSDGTYLSVSIEGRFEVGEHYGVFPGALDKFEMIYVVGTEHDLIGRRVEESNGPVYLYPLRTPPVMIRRYLTGMLSRADSLRTHPEFYNTFTNNCTSNLLKHVEPMVQQELPMGFLTIQPGYADEVAERLGLVGDGGDLESIRTKYRINDRGKASIDSADFSQRIRIVDSTAGGA